MGLTNSLRVGVLGKTFTPVKCQHLMGLPQGGGGGGGGALWMVPSGWWWRGWCHLDGALRVVAGVVPSGWCPQGGGGGGGALWMHPRQPGPSVVLRSR